MFKLIKLLISHNKKVQARNAKVVIRNVPRPVEALKEVRKSTYTKSHLNN